MTASRTALGANSDGSDSRSGLTASPASDGRGAGVYECHEVGRVDRGSLVSAPSTSDL